MTTDPYGDPDLVSLYDVDNPDGPDHDHYRALARSLDARRIIDLGCGTGLLTRTLAGPGREVIGIDPSATMLSWARARPGAGDVTWVEGDAARIAPTSDVDLVLSTGNAIMHLDDDQLAAALTRIFGALRPGGVVSFESRNPAAREWETWTKDSTLTRRDTPSGRLVEWVEVTEVAGERVSFESHTVLPDGDHRVRTSVLHFRGVQVFEAALLDAGFVAVELRGGWSGESVTERSRVVVYRARTRSTI